MSRSMLALLASLLALDSLSQTGHIRYSSNKSKCLEVEDTSSGDVSNIILNDCDTNSPNQYWKVDNTRFIITTLSGKQCFWIKHDDEVRADFVNDPVDVAKCRFVNNEGKVTAKGKPEGFQRLVFSDGTIVWRGQSKVLPENVEDRFCVEVESEDNGSAVTLQHCTPGKAEQQFQFWTKKL